MATLRETRRNIGIALVVMLVLDATALALLLSPLGGSRGARQAERDRLRAERQAKAAVALPLAGIDQKLNDAQREIADFYQHRLPGRYSQISTQLGGLASHNRVQIFSVHYEPKESEVPDLERVGIEASLAGDYVQVVKFINALERDKMFFIVQSISLGEQQGGAVRLQLKLETYLKGEA